MPDDARPDSRPDSRFMDEAIELAEGGRYTAHPNPMVGAVVVAGGEVAGRGFHRRPGAPHAEVEALGEAGPAARGADLYVTLEPCCVQGRTPPCTDTIAAAGVRRVIFALDDPDPAVAGRGTAALEAAGLEVVRGVGEEAARSQNRSYLVHRSEGRPFVIYKAAVTLDGRTSAPDSSSRWISGDAARAEVQAMRAAADAVAVGVGTVVSDDPELTCRMPGYEGPEPLRVVIDPEGRLPAGARVLNGPAPTLVVTSERGAGALEEVHGGLVELLVTGEQEAGKLDLRGACSRLADRGVVELLLEGGPVTARRMLDAELIDWVVLYMSGKVLGGAAGGPLFGNPTAPSLPEEAAFAIRSVSMVGGDAKIEAERVRRS